MVSQSKTEAPTPDPKENQPSYDGECAKNMPPNRFSVENVAPGSILKPSEIPKWLPNHAFDARPALRAFKNCLWKGVRKKH